MATGSVEVVIISTEHDFRNYHILLEKAPESTIYHTREYVTYVAHRLNAEPFFLAIKENDRMVGAMPFALRKNSRLGNIINSNPFFGSYGGLIVHPDLAPVEKNRVKSRLLDAFDNFAKDCGCILATIIASPMDRDQPFYFKNYPHNYLDRRVAQITILPSSADRNDPPRHLFEERFSQSCRRAIRSAEKKGVIVKETTEKGSALDEFYAIYKENIGSKGGLVKEKSFFEDALDAFPNGTCKLRYAELSGKVIAAIFQFYYKDIAEYFQPAIAHDHRHTGATNLLVLDGLLQAAKSGYLYWNFGGTWDTQEDVYNFKRSLGAVDFTYYYFIKSYDRHEHMKELKPAELVREYLGFYVLPFSELASR